MLFFTVNEQLYNDIDLTSSLLNSNNIPSGLWSDMDASLYYPDTYENGKYGWFHTIMN